MPYSRNFPKALTIWVSQEMFDELTRASEKSKVPKTTIIRDGIQHMCRGHRYGAWGGWNWDEENKKCKPASR